MLVQTTAARDEIARRAAALLAAPNGFGQHVLRLDRFVRTYLLHDPAVSGERRRVLGQPAFLFLSDREGGYPAESFWLEQPDGRLKEMRDVTFVDMIVDERDLVPGQIDGLQEIYAHELGHLMMAALAGPAPKRASTGDALRHDADRRVVRVHRGVRGALPAGQPRLAARRGAAGRTRRRRRPRPSEPGTPASSASRSRDA